MSEIFITPDGNIHRIAREPTQEERIKAAEKIVEEAQKTGIRIRDELVEVTTDCISLRDWFAGQALTSFANDYTAMAAAVKSYEMADAMLEARKK